MNNDFKQYITDPAMIQNLTDLGYLQMTPIQKACLPLILEGQDVTAKAKTGSGKTAAFGIPLILGLNVNKMSIQALILCPTRELADQVSGELRRLARHQNNIKIVTLCGGTRFAPQCVSLENGVHIAVGTPGRILQHLQEKTIKLDGMKTLVLDEADRMLDMGFYEDIEKIIAKAPRIRQTLLFSATFPQEIARICNEVQTDAVSVEAQDEISKSSVEQIFYPVEENDKEKKLHSLLLFYRPKSAIIFCRTKVQVRDLQAHLYDEGFDALCIHGDLEQIDRDENLIKFSNGSATILVATDVASRGLDIKDVEMVINYDIPSSTEVYIHRIGRTGRMGKKGLSVTFFNHAQERFLDELKKANLSFTCKDAHADTPKKTIIEKASMVTLCIDAGKKQKMRAGDILGVLVKDVGLDATCIGKIDINDKYAYVAIAREFALKAFDALGYKTIKGKNFRVWKLG